ncbi:hypothetical protein [Streptomyces natalensis]|uniref:hypothetical protein n=1 Tax=Streptomyces natalensis TaxID=68242 RepID=UPI0004AB279F|nr:hypothetical protein [Streptomyces natalensis]
MTAALSALELRTGAFHGAPGEAIRPLRRSGDRAGFVLVGAPDAAQTLLRARESAASARIRTAS